MEDDTDDKDMEDVKLDDKRGHHWRIIFKENDGGVDYNKELLHAKRWDVYTNEKLKIVKGGYFVRAVSYDGRKVLWEVVDDHFIEEENDHDEIVLRGFNFNVFGKDEEEVGREGLIEYLYLVMVMNIWTGYWNNQLKNMNMKVNENNGKFAGMMNGGYGKVFRFSSNEFWNNIGCLVSAHTFGIGGRGCGRRSRILCSWLPTIPHTSTILIIDVVIWILVVPVLPFMSLIVTRREGTQQPTITEIFWFFQGVMIEYANMLSIMVAPCG